MSSQFPKMSLFDEQVVKSMGLPKHSINMEQIGRIMILVDGKKTIQSFVEAGIMVSQEDLLSELFHTTTEHEKIVREVAIFGLCSETAKTEDILSFIDAHGYKPASILELLAIATDKNVTLPDSFNSLVALSNGSPVDKEWKVFMVSSLFRRHGATMLHINYTDETWKKSTLFAAIRK